MSLAVIRKEENGVEFFTVEATGESGMSRSGLARLCGVDESSIRGILKNLVRGKVRAESLEAILGKELEFGDNIGYKNAVIIRDEICSGIIEYYALDAQSPTAEAKFALRKFLRIGIRSWIQGVTGWNQLPVQQQDTEVDVVDIEQLAEDLVGIIFELIWKSSDSIVNVKNCTSRKQKKLKPEFEKGISKQLLLSLAQEFMGDIGHNAEHQHKQVIKQARLRVDPYREYFIEKLQKWLVQHPQQQLALPPAEEFPVPRTATERRQSVIAFLFDLAVEYGSLDAIPRRKKGRPSANSEADWGAAKLSQMFGVSQNTILAIWDEVDEEIKQHGFNKAKRQLLG